MDHDITTTEQAACLRLLKSACEVVTAATIAEKLRLDGSRETQRRRVRAIIKQLRTDGNWIIGCGAGLWLTRDKAMWDDYLEGRKIDGKRVIGESSRRQRAVRDASGQGLLFRLPVGSAIGGGR